MNNQQSWCKSMLIAEYSFLKDSNQDLYRPALEQLRSLIRSSTTSMTSVPKPLKFLGPHLDTLKGVYDKILNLETKVLRVLLLINKY